MPVALTTVSTALIIGHFCLTVLSFVSFLVNFSEATLKKIDVYLELIVSYMHWLQNAVYRNGIHKVVGWFGLQGSV